MKKPLFEGETLAHRVEEDGFLARPLETTSGTSKERLHGVYIPERCLHIVSVAQVTDCNQPTI